ncbi:MAG: metal-dependent hydrolase [Candidatus Thalassarchaeaceae archaeon]|jgi:membrane-bound metal-dependent hydrolase YbcI (DUF457 family)|nr:metal-dependent hydrolase [Candidatus Thalassarchaeaceae archaeon]
MDVISHWFMGSGVTQGRAKFWVAGSMGVLPDLLVFVPNTIILLLSGSSRPDVDDSTVTGDFGWYAWEAYQITHSLFWITIGFLFTWWYFEKKGVNQYFFTNSSLSARDASFWLWLPWLLHILNDIPTHTKQFFPTPFVAPISDITFDGVRWSTPWVWFTNLAIILVIWGVVFYQKKNVHNS